MHIAADPDTNTTEQFCSMQVMEVHDANTRHLGCNLRTNTSTLDHYFIGFNNRDGMHVFENHDGGTASRHSDIDVQNDLETNCTSCDFADVQDGTFIGITVEGTEIGTNESTNTRINFWNWGTDMDGDDPEDPSTWDKVDALVCQCTATNLNTDGGVTTTIDAAGSCGPEGKWQASDTGHPVIDDFACGDIP
jgi:hypothetical protein